GCGSEKYSPELGKREGEQTALVVNRRRAIFGQRRKQRRETLREQQERDQQTECRGAQPARDDPHQPGFPRARIAPTVRIPPGVPSGLSTAALGAPRHSKSQST